MDCREITVHAEYMGFLEKEAICCCCLCTIALRALFDAIPWILDCPCCGGRFYCRNFNSPAQSTVDSCSHLCFFSVFCAFFLLFLFFYLFLFFLFFILF